MRLRFFGGLAIDAGDRPAPVRGRGQEALLLRLAIDAGTTVGYRALAEDVWPDDPPEDPRAALQSLASRLRRALPAGTIEAAPGGYRLALTREDVDLTRFQDLVAAARAGADPISAAALARDALALWTGDPWTAGDGFDWLTRDLLEDRAHAERLARGGSAAPGAGAAISAAPPVSEASATHASAVPAALTPLVGRRRELDLIALQLGEARLVTLVGPGGAGKTTLALETARHHADAIVVELAPATDGEVWAAVAGAVGRSIRVDSTAPVQAATPRDRAIEALAGRELLLVLDNCEHVALEAARVTLELLRAVPGARILATSREPLGVPGEAFVDLGPLPQTDAVELFSRRVRAARGSGPDYADETLVASIVRRLDGLPLALELAAAKTRTLTLAEVAAGLDDRFALLDAGPRAVEPRHRTLRALIDWSWETLSGPERDALRAMAVFPDGLDAADAQIAGRWFGLDAAAFDALVDRSLVRRDHGRFRVLETVREYGVDRLRAEGDEARFRAAQARTMAELALARDATLRGPRVREGLAWFDTNEENLSAALRASGEQADLRQTGTDLVRASVWGWMMRERFEDIVTGVTRFDPGDGLDSEAAVVVASVGMLFSGFGAADSAAAQARALAAFDERKETLLAAATAHPSELTSALGPLLRAIDGALRDRADGGMWTREFTLGDAPAGAPAWTHAFVALLRSAIAQNNGDNDVLGVESERALSMFHDLGDVWGIAFASQMRSEWLMLEGRLEDALAVSQASTEQLAGLTSVVDRLQQRSQSVSLLARLGRIDEARAEIADIDRLARADGSQRAISQSELNAGLFEIAVGDGEAALRHLDRVVVSFDPGYPEQLIAMANSKRAQAMLLLDRPGEARELLRAAIPAAVHSGDQPVLADVALSIAGWLAATGRPLLAAGALRRAAALRGRADETDPYLRRVRAQIDAESTTTDAATDAATPTLDELAALLDEV
ncbi:AAA family ATPase [Microbacterium sp. BWT-B31]|uniref:ATP-binding protein n=1 Tax=Microbacterium sp. BWT-B31 TaxID=3232072 RepID=UPI0035282C6C